MDWLPALCLLLGAMVFFMALGLPVAFAFLSVNVIGAAVFLGGAPGLSQLARNCVASLTSFTLVPIPLFVLLGEILFHTGVAFRAIDAVEKLIARVPGRLSIVSIVGGTIFASLSGSTVANTALLGSVLLPNMLRQGYHPSIAMGPIMATGGIAMLIPPSALAVLLGSLSGISISGLLIAGIAPGLMMSVLFLGYIIIRCTLNPALAPAQDAEQLRGWRRVQPFVVYVVPLMSIFAVIVGSIVMGWATPTESAALGCVASAVAAGCYRSLTLRSLRISLTQTAKISVMILFIIAASMTFSQILTFSGATNGLLGLLTGLNLSTLALVAGMILVLLFLGCFMDQVSMLMITIPFFIPLAQSLGIPMLWLGVLMLIVMEVSFTTPPFGLILYVMKGVAPGEITMRQVYAAAAPFIGMEMVVLAVLFLFPKLVTWLPSLMSR